MTPCSHPVAIHPVYRNPESVSSDAAVSRCHYKSSLPRDQRTITVIVPSWGDGVIDVILDTVHEALVTPPGIGYRRAHVDARRGLWGSPDAGRGGRRGSGRPPWRRRRCEQPDWRSLYEQAHTRAEKERARADAAQARAEELRRAEVDSRARAGSLKWQLDTCRNKLKAASEETKEVRRAAKDAAFLPGGSGAAGKTPSHKPASSRASAARSCRCAWRSPGWARR